MNALSQQDFQEAATALGCDVAAVKAVCQVEAPKGGFNPDNTPVTLFEGHKFYKYTNGKFKVTAPDLCFPVWNRKYYGKTWQEEQSRLQRAMALDHDAALMSASWGKFQVMGFNHHMVGFDTVQQFVNAMYAGEREQLLAFVQYVKTAGLAPALQWHDWTGFARGYNGAAYADNSYDNKLAAAYKVFAAA
jgi:N-acetylmuramidase